MSSFLQPADCGGASPQLQCLNWRNLIDNLPLGVAICDAAGRLVQYNDRAARLWGQSPPAGSPVAPVIGLMPDGPFADVLCTGEPLCGRECSFTRPDGSHIFIEVNLEPLRDDDGAVVGIMACFQDITERRELRESEHRYRQILQALPAAIYTTDLDGCITFYNEAAVSFAGRRPELGDKWCVTWRLYHPDGTPLPHDECPMAVALREKKPVRNCEAVAERPDGSRLRFVPYPTPITDSAGVMTGAINMLVDISGRKEAEQQQKLLIDELNHRVKNTLASVQSLMVQTARSADTVEEFRETLEARLFAMSCAHDQLSRRSWNDADLGELLTAGLAPYGDKGNIVVAGAQTRIPPRAALMLSMVVHELATNAIKHGALSGPGGKVELGWRVAGNGAGPMLRLDWRESGGPRVQHQRRQGFGTRLLEQGIEMELGGKAALDFSSSGLHCAIEVPLAYVV
jgi:PAS domain S-box-containing protein